MIIGNGAVDRRLATRIDAHDLVIRFNLCSSFAQAPSRTDVIAVCNTGRPAWEMLGSAAWHRHPAVRDAPEIWCVRPARLFAAERARIVRDHPELDDLCDDYTESFMTLCTNTGRRCLVIDESIHHRAAISLSAYLPQPYVTPSSGLIVVEHVLREWPQADISLAGFDHAGWAGHPFAAERRLIDAYIRRGLVTRLDRHA